MKIIRGITSAPKILHSGCVATIGNFDGVHLGHQAILQQVKNTAATNGLTSVAILFEPQPLEFLHAKDSPARITHLRDKVISIAHCGIDLIIVLPFNNHLALLTSEAFVKQILVTQLNVKYLIVGEDFKFGKHRQGDFAYLKNCSKQFNFFVEKSITTRVKSRRVSSSWIREALLNNDFSLAETLLNHPYTISGHVIYGDQLGGKRGFPTANIKLHHTKSLLNGVFVGRVSGLMKQPLYGMVNIGNRPTIGKQKKLLEINLFNFDADLYGKCISVELLHKLRDEKHFASLDELFAQIARDKKMAEEIVLKKITNHELQITN